MPLAVAKLTVTGCVLASERATENVALTVPLLPSVTATSLMESEGTVKVLKPGGSQVPAVISEEGGHVPDLSVILSARTLKSILWQSIAPGLRLTTT